jgi:hypothetical protein
MLAAEAAALLLLRRAVRTETAHGFVGAQVPRLTDAIALLLFDIRQSARRHGLRRLQNEIGIDVARYGSARGYDAARARLGADGYRRALFGYARKTDSFKKAVKLADHKLVTASITETASAFNDARDQAARAAAHESGVVLWKVWDSTLDKRTCPFCERLHGSAVPASENFPEGTPGSIHPRCRCIETIATVDTIDFGRNL